MAAAALALFCCATVAIAQAQPLIIPLTGHRARPVEATTLFHTLFSDFFSEPDGTTYVQTGDIPAMWLRDSAAQTIPYLRFTRAFPILAVRFNGVIQREAENVLTDPYANAFKANEHVWEEKWEPDSLAWPVLLSWVYWKSTGSALLFTPRLHAALWKIVDTWRCEQLHAACSRYRYPYAVPTINAYNPNTGMIWSAFRPSDDPVEYRFNIPQEALVVVALRELAVLARTGYGDTNLANEASSIASQVQLGIQQHGIVYSRSRGGWIYAYETDGLGHDLFADDANIANLTSLPYIGWCSAYDPVYLRTRSYVLSSRNPWYYSGLYATGLGSPHTPPDFVWPLGIIARALTATSAAETAESVTVLAQTDSQDGLIHESFYANGYWEYTRAEFGWANALYAELIFRSVAGFAATPFMPGGGTAVPYERLSQTPTLTPLLVQLYDTGLVYHALGDLLQEADGHTIIPHVARKIRAAAR